MWQKRTVIFGLLFKTKTIQENTLGRPWDRGSRCSTHTGTHINPVSSPLQYQPTPLLPSPLQTCFLDPELPLPFGHFLQFSLNVFLISNITKTIMTGLCKATQGSHYKVFMYCDVFWGCSYCYYWKVLSSLCLSLPTLLMVHESQGNNQSRIT